MPSPDSRLEKLLIPILAACVASSIAAGPEEIQRVVRDWSLVASAFVPHVSLGAAVLSVLWLLLRSGRILYAEIHARTDAGRFGALTPQIEAAIALLARDFQEPPHTHGSAESFAAIAKLNQALYRLGGIMVPGVPHGDPRFYQFWFTCLTNLHGCAERHDITGARASRPGTGADPV